MSMLTAFKNGALEQPSKFDASKFDVYLTQEKSVTILGREKRVKRQCFMQGSEGYASRLLANSGGDLELGGSIFLTECTFGTMPEWLRFRLGLDKLNAADLAVRKAAILSSSRVKKAGSEKGAPICKVGLEPILAYQFWDETGSIPDTLLQHTNVAETKAFAARRKANAPAESADEASLD